jgi:hypothetical protein
MTSTGAVQADLPITTAQELPGVQVAASHGESDGAHPDWIPTSERFLDPTTDRLMRVWLDRQTRTRHYVPEPR